LAAVALLFSTALVVAAAVQPAALDFIGLYNLGDIDPNLTGKGLSIGLVCRSDTYVDSKPQNDYRPDISHKCFEGLKVNFYDDRYGQPGTSSHSTAIASILAGLDANAFYQPIGDFSYRSAAPDAQLNVYEFWHFITDYVYPSRWPKEDLLTISLGWSCEAWWTRGIDNMAENFGLLVVASIGNGKSSYDLPLYPAAGANILAVGVVDSNASLADFGVPDANRSSAGPTLDGRCKPDIVAPGNCLVAVADTNSLYRPSGDYSSFAAPVVAGVASMLMQKAKQEPDLQLAASPFAGNCVMKSILMTSAKKLAGWHKGFADSNDDSEYPLDFRQGAGLVDGLAAYNVLTAGMRRDGDVNTAGWDINIIEPNYIVEKVYRFQTGPAAKSRLTATLAWNRIYENRYPFNLQLSLFSNLQLQLWAIDGEGRSELVDYSDSPVDNVEHLYVSLDPDTVYELVVSCSLGSQLPDSFTSYGLSWRLAGENSEK
jgi:hypothetical protein